MPALTRASAAVDAEWARCEALLRANPRGPLDRALITLRTLFDLLRRYPNAAKYRNVSRTAPGMGLQCRGVGELLCLLGFDEGEEWWHSADPVDTRLLSRADGLVAACVARAASTK